MDEDLTRKLARTAFNVAHMAYKDAGAARVAYIKLTELMPMLDAKIERLAGVLVERGFCSIDDLNLDGTAARKQKPKRKAIDAASKAR